MQNITYKLLWSNFIYFMLSHYKIDLILLGSKKFLSKFKLMIVIWVMKIVQYIQRFISSMNCHIDIEPSDEAWGNEMPLKTSIMPEL